MSAGDRAQELWQNKGETPDNQGAQPLISRYHFNWPTVLAVIGFFLTLASIVFAVIIGVAQLQSGHLSDVNDNVNAGIDRLRHSLQSDIQDMRDDVRQIDGKVDVLATEVGYIKGRLDQPPPQETRDAP